MSEASTRVPRVVDPRSPETWTRVPPSRRRAFPRVVEALLRCLLRLSLPRALRATTHHVHTCDCVSGAVDVMEQK